MRKYKFRAWDKISKLMYGPFTLKKLIEGYGTSGMDLIWMQYTGINDRNGKEIYEGDILQSVNGKIKSPVELYNGSYTAAGYNGYYFSGFEVAGNIYEGEQP